MTACGLAVGDDAAGIHADQPLGHLQEDVDDMLDPDDGDVAAAQFLDRLDEFARLRVGEAAADLVEQQHASVGGERPRQLEPLAVEQAQASRRAGWRRAACRKARSRRWPARRLRRGEGRRRCGGDEDILEHRHAAEGLRDLVGARRGRAGSARQPGCDVTSPPSKLTVPEFGGKAPASTLSSVVLPAPFGPTMPTASSARRRSRRRRAPQARRSACGCRRR